MLAWKLQWNLYVPGLSGATKVADDPGVMPLVSHKPSSDDKLCVSV